MPNLSPREAVAAAKRFIRRHKLSAGAEFIPEDGPTGSLQISFPDESSEDRAEIEDFEGGFLLKELKRALPGWRFTGDTATGAGSTEFYFYPPKGRSPRRIMRE